MCNGSGCTDTRGSNPTGVGNPSGGWYSQHGSFGLGRRDRSIVLALVVAVVVVVVVLKTRLVIVALVVVVEVVRLILMIVVLQS